MSSSFPLVPCSLGVAFLWGMAPIVNKYMLSVHKIDPMAIIVVNGFAYAAAVTVLTLVYRKDVTKEIRRIDATTMVVLIVAAVLTAFVANLLYMYVLRDHSSSAVTALAYSAPFFTLIAAVLILKERVTVLKGVGFMLILAGIVMMAIGRTGA